MDRPQPPAYPVYLPFKHLITPRQIGSWDSFLWWGGGPGPPQGEAIPNCGYRSWLGLVKSPRHRAIVLWPAVIPLPWNIFLYSSRDGAEAPRLRTVELRPAVGAIILRVQTCANLVQIVLSIMQLMMQIWYRSYC